MTLAAAIASSLVAGAICLLDVSASAQKAGDVLKVGSMTIRQEGDTKAVTSGWFRKNGNVALAPGDCDYVVDVVPPNTLRFKGGMNYLVLNGELHGRIIRIGKLSEDLEDPDFKLMRESGDMTTIIDADGCRWTFENTTSFKKTGVTISAEKGATISFSLTGLVVTRGISFTRRTSEDDALLEASRLGNTGRVRSLIAMKTDVNAKNENGETALMAAAQSGHVDLVKALLAAKADANAKDNNGITALIVAAGFGHVEVLRALIAANVDVNTAANNGGTALHAAAKQGQVGVIRTLLPAKADVNARMVDGMSALMLAAKVGNVEIVRLLLDEQADRTATTNDGTTALSLAKDTRVKELLSSMSSK